MRKTLNIFVRGSRISEVSWFTVNWNNPPWNVSTRSNAKEEEKCPKNGSPIPLSKRLKS